MHCIPAIDVIVCRQKNIEIIQLDFGKSNTLSCEETTEWEEREKVINDWLF